MDITFFMSFQPFNQVCLIELLRVIGDFYLRCGFQKFLHSSLVCFKGEGVGHSVLYVGNQLAISSEKVDMYVNPVSDFVIVSCQFGEFRLANSCYLALEIFGYIGETDRFGDVAPTFVSNNLGVLFSVDAEVFGGDVVGSSLTL